MVRLMVGASVSLLAMLAAGAAAAQDSATPAAVLEAKARQVLDHNVELSTVWPGYWPEGQAFVLYQPAHGAVIVGGDNQPSSVRYQPGALANANTTFKFDYPVGSPNAMMMTVGDDWRASATTLFHEQFHDFQSGGFDRADLRHGGEYVDLSAIPDRAAFTAAAELERRVLADALVADTEAQRTDLARRYLALRREREATVTDDIVAKERFRERSEGTAEYAGQTAAALVLDGDRGAAVPHLVEGLRRDLITGAEGSYSGNWFRWRAYGVGAAMAWLLERSGMDWRSRVEGGEALDQILAESVGEITPQVAASLAAETRRDRDYEALFVQVKDALATMPKGIETVEDFTALGGFPLVLELEVPRSRLREGRQFSQSKGMTAVSRTAMAFPDVVTFQMEKPGVLLRVEGLSMMTDGGGVTRDGAPFRQTYTVLLRDLATLDDIIGLGTGNHSLDLVAIRGEGLNLQIDQPVTVSVAADRVTIRAALPAAALADGAAVTVREP